MPVDNESENVASTPKNVSQLVIGTSNFKISGTKPNAISIAQSARTFKGETYMPLVPPNSPVNIVKEYRAGRMTADKYAEIYKAEVLDKLDPVKVAADLNGKILLCHEDPGRFCHRRLVADWLHKTLGIDVPESGVDSVQPQSCKPKRLKIIYFPKGAAGEYAGLALNPWVGCTHGCFTTYCYGPTQFHRTKEQYGIPKLKKDMLRKLEDISSSWQATFRS